MKPAGLPVATGERVARRSLPILSWDEFSDDLAGGLAGGARLAALFGLPAADGAELIAVQADPATGLLWMTAAAVGDSYPSLTPRCPQAHLFEREIAEQLGIVPRGHPGLHPVRFHRSEVRGRDAWGRAEDTNIPPAVQPFFAVEGDEVHQVAVGPVHAGVIEPGHFRFNCHGEHVFNLEIALGYQHRGVERTLIGGPDARSVHVVEALCGDSSIAHATAYAEAVEALSGAGVSARAQVLRGVALELERLANHVGDLGALAGDVAFLPTASHCGRLRGELLNLTALLCGNRFGRGLVRPGGVRFDVEPARTEELLRRLDATLRDVQETVRLMFDSPSVQGRFEGAGPLTAEQAIELGLVGPAARACGLERDARAEFPSGIFRFAQLAISSWHSGDVFSRAWVRWLEVQRSAAFVREQLASLPSGPTLAAPEALAPDALAVSLVEAWRGEACHVAITGPDGRFTRYKVVDPSFHNWAGLALALRGEEISDFPLCNKSFNLSYCGHDL